MNEFTSVPDGPTSEQAFQEMLVELIHAAHLNDVDVEGGWEDRNGCPDMPDWEIEIYEIV